VARDHNDYELPLEKQLAVGRQRPLPPAKAARAGETLIVLVRALANKCEQAHNRRMGKILDRIRAWRRKRAAPSTDVEAAQDWKTVGKTFRATDAVFDKSLPSSRADEGRPPH
jgi:hypothetical protein